MCSFRGFEASEQQGFGDMERVVKIIWLYNDFFPLSVHSLIRGDDDDDNYGKLNVRATMNGSKWRFVMKLSLF